MGIVATLLASLICLCWISAHADPLADQETTDPSHNVEELLARLEEDAAAIQTLESNFIQEKHLTLLDKPLVLKGTISIEKPALFAWHVREPLRYSMVIEDKIVRQWDEDTDKVQEISLSKNPVFKMAIQQMRGWFSGAYASMIGEYDVTVLNEDPVSLIFVPRKTAFAQEMIENVTIVFEPNGRHIQKIQIVEKRGDSTLLTFSNTLLNIPIDPSSWKVKQRVQ
jgi:outer membrane lipoprotein-sorting protein